jgi:holin (3TMs family)
MAFDIAPYGAAISSVSDLLGGVIKRIWPEKAAEIDKLKLQAATAEFIATQEGQAALNEFADRASARTLAAADVAKGNWFTNVLAATVRPFFGYVVMGAFIASWVPALIPGGQNFVEITDIQKEIMLTVIYFFFGGRTLEKGMAMWADVKKGNGK